MTDSESDQASQESLEGNSAIVSRNLMKLLISEKSFIQFDEESFIFKINQIKQILTNICNKFIRNQYIKTGGKLANKNKIYGQIFPYGSYMLGTLGSTSDIDFLLAAPQFVKKKYIFSKLYSLFEDCELIENLKKIESAYVPIIKFSISNIKIDFTYSILTQETIDEEIDLQDDAILEGMEKESIISLNGVRTNSMILDLVEDKCLFQYVVKLLKFWARKRYIAGNVFGYLGGINLAIIAAHACQNTHEDKPDHVLLEIFYELSQWDWPHPLKINNIKKGQLNQLKSWSSQTNSEDVMPIITPAYPAMNSMRNATKSSLHQMKKEFNRAYKYMVKIVNGELDWKSLIAPPHFFSDYRIYLQVSCCATENNDFIKWRGITEKNLRKLTKNLEEAQQISFAILFPYGFEEKDSFCVRYYFALSMDHSHLNNSSSSYSDSDSPIISPTTTTSNSSSTPNQNSTHDIIIKQVNSFLEKMYQKDRRPSMTLRVKILDKKHLPEDIVQKFGKPSNMRSPPQRKYAHKPA